MPKDEDDDKNAIVEIRAGTGGLEASLFCSDLFKMYEKVCSKKKWQLEIISISKSEAGGFKEVIFSVNGNDIYSYLKYRVRCSQSSKNTKDRNTRKSTHFSSNCCCFTRS